SPNPPTRAKVWSPTAPTSAAALDRARCRTRRRNPRRSHPDSACTGTPARAAPMTLAEAPAAAVSARVAAAPEPVAAEWAPVAAASALDPVVAAWAPELDPAVVA